MQRRVAHSPPGLSAAVQATRLTEPELCVHAAHLHHLQLSFLLKKQHELDEERRRQVVVGAGRRLRRAEKKGRSEWRLCKRISRLVQQHTQRD